MDQHLFELALLRAAERLIAVMLGGVAIVLGYRLFMNVSQATDGSAEVDIPGKVKVILTRIAPGVFFALFGAGVIWASYHYQVTTGLTDTRNILVKSDTLKQDTVGQQYRETSSISYNGLGGDINSSLSYEEQERIARQTLRVLNQLPSLVPDSQQPLAFRAALRTSKLSVVRSIWQVAKWGDYAGFENWINKGPRQPVPASFTYPYALYQLNDE